jgi:hypothetical protein
VFPISFRISITLVYGIHIFPRTTFRPQFFKGKVRPRRLDGLRPRRRFLEKRIRNSGSFSLAEDSVYEMPGGFCHVVALLGYHVCVVGHLHYQVRILVHSLLKVARQVVMSKGSPQHRKKICKPKIEEMALDEGRT